MLKNLWNILRAWFRIGGEAIVDSQRITLMEQGIVNARQKIRDSERALVDVKTDRKLQQGIAQEMQEKIAEYTKNLTTMAAKGEGNSELARKVATEYAKVQNQLTEQLKTVEQQIAAERQIEDDIKKAQDIVNKAERDGNTIKAKSAVSSSTSGINSELSDAMEHQAKLKEKQHSELARLDAANEYEADKNGSTLKRELEEAGIISGGVSADDILAKFAPASSQA